jgi:hypothetical protein
VGGGVEPHSIGGLARIPEGDGEAMAPAKSPRPEEMKCER